jgi:hypothetical protein
MQQRIDLEEIWRLAKRRARTEPMVRLPGNCPFELDELISVETDPGEMADRLRRLIDAAEI